MMFLKAFLVGGLICVVGQLLLDLTKLTPAKILVGFVVVGVVLGGFGVYKYVEEFAGAGATVPLLGFGALLADGTKNAIDKDGIMGVLTGPLTAGSAGITAAVVSGIIASFFGKPKAK
ncbi:MAG: stage V sporulation protein AE [Clostridia bacterium]|nr:stage V sporulation protein AE [Clostridia bacterium]